MKKKLLSLFLALVLLGGCGGGENGQNINGEESASPDGSGKPSASSTAKLEEKEYSFENPKPAAISEPGSLYMTAEDLTITDADMLSLRDQFYEALKEQLKKSGLNTLDETRGNHGLSFSALYTVSRDQKDRDNHYCDMVVQSFAYTTEREEPRLIYTYCEFAYTGLSPVSTALQFYEDYHKNGTIESLDLCLRTLVEYRSHVKWVGGLMSHYVVKDDPDSNSITEEEFAEQVKNDRILYQNCGGGIFFDAEEVKTYSAIFGERETQ